MRQTRAGGHPAGLNEESAFTERAAPILNQKVIVTVSSVLTHFRHPPARREKQVTRTERAQTSILGLNLETESRMVSEATADGADGRLLVAS